MSRIAVQVVLFHSRSTVGRLLRGLELLQVGGHDVTVHFLDNGPDGTDEVLQSTPLRLPWTYRVSPRGNVGFGAGHNLLAAEHGGDAEYLLLLNPDAIPFDDMLLRLVVRAREDPRAALVEAAQFPVEHQKAFDLDTLHTDWCCGTALLVRSCAFAALGGFDERLFLYCEDVDLSWRAWVDGWTCLYDPLARCLHVSQEEDLGKDRSAEIHHLHLGGAFLRAKWFGGDAVADYLAFLDRTLPGDVVARVRVDLARIAPARPLGVHHSRVRLNDDHVNYGPTRW